MRAAIDELPDEQCRVIELAYFGGFSHSQIADQLDMPIGTVKGRMRLGLDKLRRKPHHRGAGDAYERRAPRDARAGHRRLRAGRPVRRGAHPLREPSARVPRLPRRGRPAPAGGQRAAALGHAAARPGPPEGRDHGRGRGRRARARARIAGRAPAPAAATDAAVPARVASVTAAVLLVVGIAGGFGLGQLTGDRAAHGYGELRHRPRGQRQRQPGHRRRRERPAARCACTACPTWASNETYQVWLQRDGEVIPKAMFTVSDNGDGLTAVDDLKGADRVMVTREPAGGARAPSGPPGRDASSSSRA